MILVSGAGGKTGQAVVAALVAAGYDVRPWLRRADAARPHAFVGDMRSQDDWLAAMAGVSKLYHICPNMNEDEIEIGRCAITAAQQSGIAHFVYHSVLHPQTEKMPHHWQKLRVEEMLFESGLPFTLMQPGAYMQNIDVATIMETGVLVRPYPSHTRLSLVDLQDVGEAAAIVLRDEQLVGATLPLVGTRPLTQTEVAATIEQVIGRAVTVREQSIQSWESANALLPEYGRNSLIAMFGYYAAYGFVGNPFTLKAVLKREPTTLAACIHRLIV